MDWQSWTFAVSQTLSYVWTACVAAGSAFYLRRLLSARVVYLAMLYLDAFGIAMCGVQGTGKTWDLDFGLPAGPVILGVVTAIGGGVIRDVLAGRTTLLMQPELYAVPVLIGCIGFVLVLAYLPDHRLIGSIICIPATLVLRVATIHLDLQMPRWPASSTMTGNAPDPGEGLGITAPDHDRGCAAFDPGGLGLDRCRRVLGRTGQEPVGSVAMGDALGGQLRSAATSSAALVTPFSRSARAASMSPLSTSL